jgi:methionine-gamma-lyase
MSRMAQHSRSALAVADMLSNHPAIAAVYYPWLAEFSQIDIARRQMSAGSGLVAFELKDGLAAGRALINSLELAKCAVSLGDAETLIEHPASMTHAAYSTEEREQYGITEGLIRMSIGLESTDDILEDLSCALGELPS